VASPKDRPDEDVEDRRLADISERVDPVPPAVLEAARDAFRSRRRKHSEAEELPDDSDGERAVEATNNDAS